MFLQWKSGAVLTWHRCRLQMVPGGLPRRALGTEGWGPQLLSMFQLLSWPRVLPSPTHSASHTYIAPIYAVYRQAQLGTAHTDSHKQTHMHSPKHIAHTASPVCCKHRNPHTRTNICCTHPSTLHTDTHSLYAHTYINMYFTHTNLFACCM